MSEAAEITPEKPERRQLRLRVDAEGIIATGARVLSGEERMGRRWKEFYGIALAEFAENVARVKRGEVTVEDFLDFYCIKREDDR